MYSSAKFGCFKSNCMTEGKWLRGRALLGWGDLCHPSVWGFTGFKLELELCGRTLSLSWLITTEPRQGTTFQTEAETMRQSRGRGSKVETVWGRGEAEPAKNNCLDATSSRGRCLEDYIAGCAECNNHLKSLSTASTCCLWWHQSTDYTFKLNTASQVHSWSSCFSYNLQQEFTLDDHPILVHQFTVCSSQTSQ